MLLRCAGLTASAGLSCFTLKHLWAPNSSWIMFLGVLESPGKCPGFLSVKEWESWTLKGVINSNVPMTLLFVVCRLIRSADVGGIHVW